MFALNFEPQDLQRHFHKVGKNMSIVHWSIEFKEKDVS
jgi:hypothetical protein